MKKRKLIVTHHCPDLDAIASTWVLKRFDRHHYEDAEITFVNPGERISAEKLTELDIDSSLVTHVDTGLGKFDHHQPERAKQKICAASLTYEYICELHPEFKQDQALAELIDFVTEIDHFQEIYWPEPSATRYVMIIHELLRGHELTHENNDQSQMEFGLQCLDYGYQALKSSVKARELIEEKGIKFKIKAGHCLGIETTNEDTIKEAQKMGYVLVVRKDEKYGHIRIKIRPDTDFSLAALDKLIKKHDDKGTWFYHNSGKMLLNGSNSHSDQVPSELSLKRVIKMIKEIYE